MSVDRIRALLELMQSYGLTELELDDAGFKVKLSKSGGLPSAVAPGIPAGAVLALPAIPPGQAPAAPMPAASAAPAAPLDDESCWRPVKSPIVGTFFRSSSPDADPYVASGASVKPDTVVCIIEAMKTMNEIKAGLAGTVMRVLVENGEPVEYDQPLFLVKP